MSLAILDVGHGNSAVLVDNGSVLVIDAGPGSALLEYLRQEGITRIDVILISHADQDHVAGLIGVIASEEFEIGMVRLNSDASKGSKIWDDLQDTLDTCHTAGTLNFNVALTIRDTGIFDRGEVHIQILAPSLYIAGKGPGSTDRKGRHLTSNSVSAVIRLVRGGQSIALFPGDMDDVGLDNLAESGQDCSAPILVFPHHGGRPGSADMEVFARRLCEMVAPQFVIFSIGRGKHNTPQPEIVASVRNALPTVHVTCTQLSERCATDVPASEPKHLAARFAQGK
jgi:beta-lactamase superfamily II metal-dependent hydrolase